MITIKLENELRPEGYVRRPDEALFAARSGGELLGWCAVAPGEPAELRGLGTRPRDPLLADGLARTALNWLIGRSVTASVGQGDELLGFAKANRLRPGEPFELDIFFSGGCHGADKGTVNVDKDSVERVQ